MSDLQAAYAEWLHARQRVARYNGTSEPTEADDKALCEDYNATVEAEWKMLRIPADGLADVRTRARVTQDMFAMAAEEGEPTDNRQHLMLSLLIKEIVDDEGPLDRLGTRRAAS
jgi:hypothetical protein